MLRKSSRFTPPVCAVLGVLCALGALPVRAQTPEQVGQWSAPETWPVAATHSVLLPTGKVLFIGEFDQGSLGPHLWDPLSGAISLLPNTDYNAFCAGHSFLEDGRLLVTGGHEASHVGYPHVSIFDPVSSTWSRAPDMNANRWYPTNTTLATGEVVVLSGEMHHAGENNPLPQVYHAPSNTWRDLVTALKDIPYYPRTFLAPNGKLFCAGPRTTSYWLDTAGTGSWFDAAETLHTDSRTYGPAVMMDGKVLLIGGGDPPTASVEEIDLRSASPAWRARAPMTVPRRQHNAVLLPDGQVLVVGGSSGAGFNNRDTPALHAEVWNPATNTWTRLASTQNFYGYHSSSLLLPDGRVLLAGGRGDRPAELFSPPYLFKGARPSVSSAPTQVRPGSLFSVSTPDAASITRVTLIALGAVTHAFDQHQRLLTLPFSAEAGALNVFAPTSNLDAPPGYYQLFLVNAQGVPSLGHMVKVERAPLPLRRVVSFSDVWKYDDSGVDRGTAWLEAGFDDSAWPSGPGQLGYGEDDQSTTLPSVLPSRPSTYFRKKFVLDGNATSAFLDLLFDDGVAVWLNGVLVYSYNVSDGLDYATYASGSSENRYVRVSVPLLPGTFRQGENVVTALVKQVSDSSSDLSFALGLDVETSSEPLPESVSVLAPNGGELLVAGSTTEVRWSSSGTFSTVDLVYSLDGGATWTPLASGTANDGVHPWVLPDVSTQQALVRVSKAGESSPTDVSDAPFRIEREMRALAIPFGSVWKYHDSGVDPGSVWSSPGYDDSAWPSGPAQLGYGDRDEATVLTRTDPSQTSVYFRRTLTLSGPVSSATLRVLFDDGVAVYVNGTQVFARNVDRGTEHWRYATASEENRLDEAPLSLSPNPFVVGDNVIGVMVKQTGRTSPDLSFDLELDLGVTSPLQ